MKLRCFAVLLVCSLPAFGETTQTAVVARAQALLDASFAEADEAIVAPVQSLPPETLSSPKLRLWTSTSKAEIEAVSHYFRFVPHSGVRVIEGADGTAVIPGVFCRCDGQLLLILKKEGRAVRSIVIFHGTRVASDGLPSTGPMCVDPTVLAPFYRPLMQLAENRANQARDRTAPSVTSRAAQEPRH